MLLKDASQGWLTVKVCSVMIMIAITFLITISTALCFIGVRTASVSIGGKTGAATMLRSGITLPDLPYAYTALEPHISERTLRIHHDKHHAKYVATTNDMIKGTDMEENDVVTVLRKAFTTNQVLFNNAAQSFNHEFYWNCMKAHGGGKPTGRLLELIEKDFGSFENFRKDFSNAANTAFGSGWAWLVQSPAGLKVTKTIGANNPLTEADTVPLLTCDVWEHAYYLDYQNLRPTYVDAFLDHLVDWDAVAARLE